jgi:putative peptide zinc metalloprotease protein
VSTLVDAPIRVDGVQLLGAMVGSGYRTPPALVRRGDGQVLQLTPLLYQVLRAVDGRRSCAEIAEVVSAAVRRDVTEADVRALLDGQLRPRGLVAQADGSEVALPRANPLLRLKPRVAITEPRTTRFLTDPFRALFRPMIATAVLLGFIAVVGWVFFDRGLGASAYDAFERPHLLLLVFVVSVLSGGFHEFGHAAAARYGGAQPGTMGAGLYLVWPAFYTDVTDSYRLDRVGRIRTDLGGLYFNAVVVVLTFAWWWWTGWEALLLLVATQVLQMVQQLLPLFRFDGYHLLADLAGVPDLYHRIRPTLVGLLPHLWNLPENKVLTRRARAIITLWVLVTVPMMVLMLLGLVAAVPRLVGSAASAVRADASAVADAWGAGSPLDVSGHALQLLGVVLPVLAAGLILGRVGVRFFRGLARWSEGSAGKRLVAACVSAVVLTALTWAWWPHPGTYRPIQPGERGLITDVLQLQPAAATPSAPDGVAFRDAANLQLAASEAQDRLLEAGPLIAVFGDGAALPTKADPQLAMVLTPAEPSDPAIPGRTTGEHDGTATATPGPAPTITAEATPGAPSDATPDEDTSDDVTNDSWVFPFNRPLPPDEGDNQALAVATADDSVVYDVALALVWSTGDEVLNVNEAHAYASCSNCIAVAVAFQVVLVLDDAQVVVPQNLAVAANYDCYRCITAAIASQLVLSVQEEPGEEELLALSQIWNQLVAFASTMTSYSVSEITEQLEGFKAQIVAILDGAPILTPDQSASATASGSSDAGSSTATADSSSPTEQVTTGTDSPPAEVTDSPTGESVTTAPSSPIPTETSTAPLTPSSSPTSSPTTSPSTSSIETSMSASEESAVGSSP